MEHATGDVGAQAIAMPSQVYRSHMGIRDLLLGIGTTYDHELGTDRGVAAQDLIRASADRLAGCVPSGLRVKASGGQGSATFTPWIGLFDPEETLSSHKGLYLVYIFAADMRSVYLVLNQGVTDLKDDYGVDGAEERLKSNALNLLQLLPPELVENWQDTVDLRAGRNWRQRGYIAGSVVAREYSVEALPEEAELRADLRDMADVFRQAIRLKKTAADLGQPTVRDRNAAIQIGRTPVGATELEGFRPKDSGEYIAHVKGRTLHKSRSHEKLIDDFVHYIKDRGFRPASIGAHPRDLVLYRDDKEWIVEAKFVADKKARDATRQALAQLLEYQFCLYEKAARPYLIALFSEDIGELFGELLREYQIGVIWRTSNGWRGSDLAERWGMV